MEIDINTLRAIATVVSFAAFVAIVCWAWSKRRSSDFAQAAELPFLQD